MTVSLANRVRGLQLPVFREIATLAKSRNAIDLGGGTPNFPAPVELKAAAVAAVQSDYNQYALSQGIQELRKGIAGKLHRQHGGQFDPETEITVCCGATEGMAASLLTIVNPGDEVIILEPAFTIYAPDVVLCGGKPVYVELRPPNFRIERDALAAVLSPRTKAIIVNSPHNPTGRVFDPDELAIVADICRQHDLAALTDEIYDEIVFDGITPAKLWTIAGMRERTIIVNGFSKTYSVTGWRLGYVVAPPQLTQGIRIAHNYLTISAAAPLQEAAVEAIRLPGSYYQKLKSEYTTRRDLLINGLEHLGIPCLLPQGGYFLLADFSRFGWSDDVAFAKHLIETIGVAAVPLSGFYRVYPNRGRLILRFAFCKTEETLHKALQRLEHIERIKYGN
ncbi:MAG TPA: aminotransferase class I/II-fold pyridoxal phosphate-dependent enzyme [Methylomusa anaerophila]|uniref:Aminotransferase n=1 Tax=Methylomusa anaerophila TaxID=1930071 RepID=A0A348AEW0_9FIRM|nr:aminotransferase class I/II-fold pyridoxal phosphate-dependent enzyme [Methylomusa anaerophila]BBB89608.1 methionine aminotransferase [Methylomusa anaerophila]HML89619.1 aminotransferase class I/II-fold pyridoxal phosphate-dependent enzyme [Methylomusa anaerophila]